MRKKLMLLLLCVMLTGCKSNTEEVSTNVEVNYVNVPLSEDHWAAVPIFAGDPIMSTDGYVQWEMGSGASILKCIGDVSNSYTKDDELTIYYSDYDVTLVLYNNESWIQYVYDAQPQVYSGIATLDPNKEVGKWASVKDLEYVLDDEGILMPKDYTLNSMLMPAYKNGTSYFTTAVRYWSEEEVENLALSYLAANPEGDIDWMRVDGHFMAHNDKVGVGYKKITVNKYIVYISSGDMFDYILLNIQKVLIK